ncbi:hypothetical protein [Acetobacterium wieringae]|uniref:hypothetical protein n=1 Tax=Acetobacterium wieringae TaxID=52694 RepID=UPI0026EFA9C9|nr:hypothetical protein [Acetobacterium wieringae]
MINTHLKEEKAVICQEDGIREIKLTCTICSHQCKMTLLMEGLSILMVKDDGCKKGSKFAYQEMKIRRTKRTHSGTKCSEIDRIKNAI